MTGPEENVGRFQQAGDKLNMQDAVRLCKAGDEDRLLAMTLRKLENGYSLQGKFLRVLVAKQSSLMPEAVNDTAQDGDDEPLTPDSARIFRTCVGQSM